jgi:hypothetical protein
MRNNPHAMHEALADDGLKDAPTVRDRPKIACPADPQGLKACDLDHLQPLLHGPDVEQRLDLETGTIAL